MAKATYGRMLLNEFYNLNKMYDIQSYLNKLEKARLMYLNIANEEEIKRYKLYKEHYLVHFFKKTTLEIRIIENQFCCNSPCLIDDPSIGNSPRFKNDLMSLRLFISKLDKGGYSKDLKIC